MRSLLGRLIALMSVGLMGCATAAQPPPTITRSAAVLPTPQATFTPAATRTPPPPTSELRLLPTLAVDDLLASATPIEHISPGQGVELETLTMMDGFNGWATGRAREGSSQLFPHVLRTQDGGKSWMDITPPWPVPIMETDGPRTFFLDSQRAWVAYTPPEAILDPDDDLAGFRVPALIIWRTSDGGQSWETTSFLNPMPEYYPHVELLQFADALNGWLSISANFTLLLRTTDGGVTWGMVLDSRDQPDSDMNMVFSKVFAFADSQVGVFTLGLSDRTGPPAVNWTSDGGFTWQRQELPPTEGLSTSDFALCATAAPYFFGPQQLSVLLQCRSDMVSGRPNFLYRTDDGGDSWRITELPPANPYYYLGNRYPKPSDYNHFYLNGRIGWTYIVHPPQTEIYSTDDGGAQWREVTEVNWPSDLIRFVSPQVGFGLYMAYPDPNRVFRTADGGLTWERITPVVAAPVGRPGGATILCPDVLPSRVGPGSSARVTYTDGTPLAIRTEPGLSTGKRIDYLAEGARMMIMEGPVCADGYAWWRVETPDGLTGWVAEGDTQVYFLEPLE